MKHCSWLERRYENAPGKGMQFKSNDCSYNLHAFIQVCGRAPVNCSGSISSPRAKAGRQPSLADYGYWSIYAG